MDTLSNKGKPERRQAEKGDKASGRRAHHPTKGNKKIKKEDELGDKLDDKMGNKLGDKLGDHWEASWETSWETRETRLREGRHTIQQRETRRKKSWETTGRQAGRQGLGKTDTPSNQGKKEGRQAGRQGQKTSWETRWATSWGTRVKKPPEGEGQKTSWETNRRQTNWETRGGTTADTPSNKGTHVGRQWETRPRGGGHTIQQ